MSKERPRIIVDSRGTEREVKKPLPNTPKENIIAFPDKKEIKVNWRRNFDRLQKMKEISKEMEIVQDKGVYNIQLDRPDIPWGLGLVFSDSHIGSLTTDHELIKDMLDLTLNTPNTFLMDAGDTFDNGIWGGMQFEASIPPYMQSFTVKDMARELGDKYACMAIGNHSQWIFSQVGQRPEDLFYREIKGPIFAGMGLLELKAKNQEYDVAITHTYWGKSKKNIFNCCVNFRNNEYPNADAFIVGHEHIWGHAEELVDNKRRLYVRPGTAKVEDRYARMHGIARRGQKMGIGILFNTERHYLEAKPINEAVKNIKALL